MGFELIYFVFDLYSKYVIRLGSVERKQAAKTSHRHTPFLPKCLGKAVILNIELCYSNETGVHEISPS